MLNAVRSLVAALVATVCFHGIAGTPEEQFNDGKALAAKMQSTTSAGINDGSSANTLKSSIPGYTESPPEKGLYGNADAMASQAADAKAACASSKDPKCAALKQSQVVVPTGYIKLDSPVLRGQAAIDNPVAFVGDISKQYSACTVTDATITSPAQFEEKSCSVNFNYWATGAACERTRTVVPDGAIDCDAGQVIGSAVVWRNGSDPMQVQVMCPAGRADGKMTVRFEAHGGSGSCNGWQSTDLDMTAPAVSMSHIGVVIPIWGGGWWKGGRCIGVDVYQYGLGCVGGPGGTCSKTFRFDLQPNGEVYEATVKFNNPKKLPPSESVDGCSAYESKVPTLAQRPDGQPSLQIDQVIGMGAVAENKSYCWRTTSTCVEGPETRVIKSIPVTRSCWKWANQYTCGDRLPSSTCDPDSLKGCSQSAEAVCDLKDGNGSCLSLAQKYQCQTKGATVSPAVTCADSTTFCDGGSCYDQSYTANTGLGKSAAILEAMKQAGKDFSDGGGNPIIFVGNNKRCSKKAVGLFDCCELDSLLDPLNPVPADIADVACSDEEKELAVKKVEGKCHAMGEYCSSKKLGICLKKSINHCCFGSKLVRIIHEQGRPQVGRSWGPDNGPDCSGLSIEEIQKMDFAAMDFSDFTKDLKITMPDASAIQGTATSKSTSCYYGAGKC